MNINVIRHVSTPCLCQTSFPLSPVFVTEFGRRRVRRTCNKSELNVILSLHVCGNIHIELALLMKEIYSTRCFSDNAQVIFFSLHGATSSNRSRAPNYRAFEITFRHTTLGDQPEAPPPAWQNTTLTRDGQTYPQSQQASGRRPTP